MGRSGHEFEAADSVVIGRLLLVSPITYFAIAGNLMNYSRALISGISTTMTPRASVLSASGNQAEVQKLLIPLVSKGDKGPRWKRGQENNAMKKVAQSVMKDEG